MKKLFFSLVVSASFFLSITSYAAGSDSEDDVLFESDEEEIPPLCKHPLASLLQFYFSAANKVGRTSFLILFEETKSQEVMSRVDHALMELKEAIKSCFVSRPVDALSLLQLLTAHYEAVHNVVQRARKGSQLMQNIEDTKQARDTLGKRAIMLWSQKMPYASVYASYWEAENQLPKMHVELKLIEDGPTLPALAEAEKNLRDFLSKDQVLAPSSL